MNDLWARATEHPAVLAVLILVLGTLVYALIKRLLKLVMVVVLGFLALWAGFVYTGEDPPEALKRMAEGAGLSVDGPSDAQRKGRDADRRLGEGAEEPRNDI